MLTCNLVTEGCCRNLSKEWPPVPNNSILLIQDLLSVNKDETLTTRNVTCVGKKNSQIQRFWRCRSTKRLPHKFWSFWWIGDAVLVQRERERERTGRVSRVSVIHWIYCSKKKTHSTVIALHMLSTGTGPDSRLECPSVDAAESSSHSAPTPVVRTTIISRLRRDRWDPGTGWGTGHAFQPRLNFRNNVPQIHD